MLILHAALAISGASCLVRFSCGRALLTASNANLDLCCYPRGLLWHRSTTFHCLYSRALPVFVTTTSLRCACCCRFSSRHRFRLKVVQSEALLALLQKHKACFNSCASTLAHTSVAVQRIETDGSSVIRHRPYPASKSERKVNEGHVMTC